MSPLFRHWSVGVIGYAVVAVAAVYVTGYVRRQRVTGDRAGLPFWRRRWQAASFLGGMVAIFVALESPIGYYSDFLFWVHMIQYLLLTVVAAPLIVIGAPWLIFLQALPARWRRGVTRTGFRRGWARPFRAFGRAVNRPLVAWPLFAANLWFWHMPWPYDQTLKYLPVQYTEHLLTLGLAILLWLQVINSYPLRSSLSYPGRLAFLASIAAQNWILSVLLTFGSGVWYAGYADLASRPGNISALQDQQIGAGILWIPGMVPIAMAAVGVAIQWMQRGRDADLDAELAALLATDDAGASLEPGPASATGVAPAPMPGAPEEGPGVPGLARPAGGGRRDRRAPSSWRPRRLELAPRHRLR